MIPRLPRSPRTDTLCPDTTLFRSVESGFAQADLIYSAYSGEGVYFRRAKQPNLRVLANLYPETVHLVVRRGSGIDSITDLPGKRLSIDRTGSGTRFNAEITQIGRAHV